MAGLDRGLLSGRMVRAWARWQSNPMRRPQRWARAASTTAGVNEAAAAGQAAAGGPLAPLTDADLRAHISTHGLQVRAARQRRGLQGRCVEACARGLLLAARVQGLRLRSNRVCAPAPALGAPRARAPRPHRPPRAAPQAAVLPRPADLDEGDVIKSLVFTANSQPVLVVAPLAAKVGRELTDMQPTTCASARARAGTEQAPTPLDWRPDCRSTSASWRRTSACPAAASGSPPRATPWPTQATLWGRCRPLVSTWPHAPHRAVAELGALWRHPH
jgi:hypothetical protein